MQSKSRKKLVLTGAALFNSKPKAGLTFLEENQLIYADLSPEVTRAYSLAAFLKGCTRIDKRLLGDFISKPDNVDVLKAFIGLFDFKDVRFYERRLVCVSYRLTRNRWRMRCESCSRPSDYLEKLSRFQELRRLLLQSILLLSPVRVFNLYFKLNT